MPNRRILILGGTRDARELADQLVTLGFEVTTSLAGVTESPALPAGHIRTGGFGGVEGLVAYLAGGQFDQVVDAAHPFATQISKHAVAACAQTKTSLLRVEREAWVAEAGDQWTFARDGTDALNFLPQGARVMLTLGRKEVSLFFARDDLGGVARMIERPDAKVPASITLVLQRPPYDMADELALMQLHHVQYLLCKNSGGPRAHKLDAARKLGVRVIILSRPEKPQVETVASVEQAVAHLLGRAGVSS